MTLINWPGSMIYHQSSSSSSYIHSGFYCSPYRDPVRKHLEHNAIQNCVILSKRTNHCPSQCLSLPQKTFIGTSDCYKWPKQDKNWRSVVVRSEIAGTGSPGASYRLSEIHLGSKIRGIGFYTMTSFIAIFLFVVMVVGHPFVLLWDRYQRNFQHFVAKIWASLTIAPFFRLKIQGSENLPPKDSPAVYVSNHQSFLDIYTLLTLGRNFKFVSKTAIFLYPLIGWAMYLLGTIPLKRMDRKSQMQTLKRCMELVKNGGSVFFFPEGTRSKDGSLGTFKKGAFSIAAKTGVPVVPITLMGTGKIMPVGMESSLNPGMVKIVIHKPIKGDNPDILCTEARNVIADELIRQG
uniref:1-acyl-sn-glycerol-3-phosphate acyltransferase BAT2, chloroplastic n=1 Tax=Erigeron canadensis TaxID=72917 RepID=UPI001CB8E55F|nr:1-acyl-sn-glycerol-3-phosphate acyltransferase BAT2, chloroplastic [Erigeron canadensis]